MKLKDNLIFEDNHLLAINKKAGLLTQRTTADKDNLEDLARIYLKEKMGKESVFLHAIHRLDRVTSGVCVFAKSSKALSRLQKSLRERKVKKNYLAILEDKPASNKGTIELLQKKDKYRASLSSLGKKSILHYEILAKCNGYFLADIHLVTGKYHQIRLAFSEINCPIIGDQKYHSMFSVDFDGICLHQKQFCIKHPTQEQEIHLVAPPPESEYWNLFRKIY